MSETKLTTGLVAALDNAPPDKKPIAKFTAPAEQLSWKVVCDRESIAHHRRDRHRFAPDRFCVDPRPAQPQAPQGHCGAAIRNLPAPTAPKEPQR